MIPLVLFGNFGCDFRFEAKPFFFDGDGLNDFTAEHFIAGFPYRSKSRARKRLDTKVRNLFPGGVIKPFDHIFFPSGIPGTIYYIRICPAADKGSRRRTKSLGSYSVSASCITTTSPVAA